MTMLRTAPGILITLALLCPAAHAHPVPRDNHDRHIAVHLLQSADANQLLVRIEYRLEVDELTVTLDDMKPFLDEVDATLLVKEPLRFYDEFTRLYGPIFGDNLLVKSNGNALKLVLKRRSATLRDEKNEPLGHLRCEFVYEAPLPLHPGDNVLEVTETNYRDQDGQIFLTFTNGAGVTVLKQSVPDVELNKLHPTKRDVDHERQLRNLSITFRAADRPVAQAETPAASDTPPKTAEKHDEGFLNLFRELRQRNTGIALMLLLFVVLGAAHALTPGHGKTLVAAYLVGERGTIWHAIVLGLVTTLTHTGIVLAIAAVLFFLPTATAASAREALQLGLGLVMGLVVTCIGFWLLLQRLAGRADHLHLGAGHHHHHHDGHEHSHPHDEHGETQVRWGGIVLLGMTGGLVPCWDAVMILIAVVGTSEFWFALPALLAFSAGLAGVLVAIGVLVVKFRRVAESKWGSGRLVRALPLISACLITAMGLWLCFESVQH